MRNKGFLFIFILWLVLPGISIAKPTRITTVHASARSGEWRMVFTAKGPIQYRSFQLRNPSRIVVDVQNAVLVKRIRKPALLNSPIKNIRSSYRGKNDLRIVLDLHQNVKLKTFTLSNPNRLVIDMFAGKTPVLAFDWPFGKGKTPKKKPEPITPYVITAFKPSMKSVIVNKRPKRSKNIIVVIDPGHGGKDPGAVGVGGTYEKRIVLAISKDLQNLINRQPGFKAILTRNGDYYLTLRQRLAIARRDKADMFVAIHADAYRNRTAHGAAVYAVSQRGATSEAARWLAKRENQSELMGGVKLTDKSNILRSVLINLSQTATIRASLQIGHYLLRSIGRVSRLHHSRVEQAAFVVLKSPDIPSLLVESGFLSNRHEERRLRSSSYRHRLATSIMFGIKRYFKQFPPRGTWLAMQKENPEHSNVRYVVAQGDTLSTIAARYRVTSTLIRRVNRLTSNHIYVGQRLVIPGNLS